MTVPSNTTSNPDCSHEDFDPTKPPFTQRKRICRVVLSDLDDEPMVGKMVVQDAEVVISDRVSLLADSKPAAAEEQPVPPTKPTALSRNMTGSKQTTATKNRPKAANYDAATRRIIETAIEFYHALLLTENPFPDSHDELDWVRDAWDASRIYYKLPDAELESSIIKIVSVVHGRYTNRSLYFRSLHVGHTCAGNSN